MSTTCDNCGCRYEVVTRRRSIYAAARLTIRRRWKTPRRPPLLHMKELFPPPPISRLPSGRGQ